MGAIINNGTFQLNNVYDKNLSINFNEKFTRLTKSKDTAQNQKVILSSLLKVQVYFRLDFGC